MFENLCYGGPLGTVSRDHQYTRRSTFWSISSPSCFSIQHSHVLRHWVIKVLLCETARRCADCSFSSQT
ncbi:hypothetical protein H5410_040411 [Solanum commersonii]|uniref:Uncharacterized protein n=1 Tax=Solanum commersonii TaxID=4109 RepID=A0A9J5XNU4_SOLCO|nr:hypothetical protein H5410_040411 [Solanum commersonii]